MSLDETEFARFAAGSVFIAVPIVLLYFFPGQGHGERHGCGRGERVIRNTKWQPPRNGDPEYKVAAAADLNKIE